MARPKGPPGSGLKHKVEARISSAEKDALDRLCQQHGALLASQGIADGGCFSVWLRAVLRKEAAASGFPVEDGAPGRPVSPRAGSSRGART